MFNIISEKMRERLHGVNQDHDRPAPAGSPRKRSASGNQKAQGVEPAAEPGRKGDG